MDATRTPSRPPAAAPGPPVGPGRLRLVCLPQAGGDAVTFERWLPHLPQGYELAPVTDADGGRPATFGEWARRLLQQVPPDGGGPFVLFGHGTGALLAYEITRQLTAFGGPLPLALLVSGSRAPHVPPAPRLSGLDDAALLDWLLEHGGVPLDLLRRRDLLAGRAAAIRTALALAEDYLPQVPEPLGLPLHAFGGIADRVAPCDALNDWRACAGADFSATVLPGGHAFPQTGPGALLASVDALVGDPAADDSGEHVGFTG